MKMKQLSIPLMLLALAFSAFADDDAVDPKKIYDKLDPNIYRRRGIDVKSGVTHFETNGVSYEEVDHRETVRKINERLESLHVVPDEDVDLRETVTRINEQLEGLRLYHESTVTHTETGVVFSESHTFVTNGSAAFLATNLVDLVHLIEINQERTEQGIVSIPIHLTTQLRDDFAYGMLLTTNGSNAVGSSRFRDESQRATLLDAVAAIKRALAEGRLVITPVGTNTVRISRKAKDK